MTNFHIKKNGEPGVCKAEPGSCPLGGEHFDTPDAAREAYEHDMKDLQLAKGKIKVLNDTLAFDRKEFFTPSNAGNYSLIDIESGTVFSTNSVVMEDPDDDDFYEYPSEFVPDDAQMISEVDDLSKFERPVVVELDTGLVLGVDPTSLHAVDISKEIVDFDEILDSAYAAEKVAREQGFPLWD